MSDPKSVEFQNVTTVQWPTLPKLISIRIENLRYEGEWVEGVLVVKYEFNGEHDARVPFKTKLNEQVSLPVGPLTAHFHVWLNGPKLCFGLKVCIGPLCSQELSTCVDAPH